jgi:hypothetical protein
MIGRSTKDAFGLCHDQLLPRRVGIAHHVLVIRKRRSRGLYDWQAVPTLLSG